MLGAVARLMPAADHLLIDAMRLDLPCAQTSIIYGDSLSISIAAASVIAKVYRDRRMCEYHQQWPQYGLHSHKGYSTPEHKRALAEHGPTPLHRFSFRPVAQRSLPWDYPTASIPFLKENSLALRLMCVTAHPDDESGGFGGALLMAHARRADTTVICLTEGRAASNRGDTRSDDELAAARLAEMEISCGILGVTRHEVWKYPDGALIQANLFEITTRLVERMRQLRPHIVLTFGGDGGPNLHRDHAVAGFAATAAFHWSGRSNFAAEQLKNGLALWAPHKLYYEATKFTVSKFKEEAAVAPRTAASCARARPAPGSEAAGGRSARHAKRVEPRG